MSKRIIFNGQDYASPEAMPDEIRDAYLSALAMFRDANPNGIPDALESGSASTIVGVQQASLSINGRPLGGVGPLPLWARRLVESMIGREGTSSISRPTSSGSAAPDTLDSAQATLGPLLAFVAGFVLIFSVGLMFAIGGGDDHLFGRLIVAVAALLLLGWIDTHATRLARRRQPLLAPDTAGYRRFAVWSASGLLLAMGLLLSLAWFLP